MARNLNVDDRAFERATNGLVQPILILLVLEDAAEDAAVVNPHLPQQTGIGMPPPRQPDLNTEDSLNLEFIMADAPDLKSLQEIEGYLYVGLGSETNVPEDSDDSDVSDDDDVMDVIFDGAGDQYFDQ